MNACTLKDIQRKILYIMQYIDSLCRKNGITYYIMGGTALGAVRHGGFIPWDDDLDIFMTPGEYARFKTVFQSDKNSQFVIQEWRTTPDYLEYAKVRMNGTTFIESVFKDRTDMHHGIYVDIMILHKAPNRRFTQRKLYFMSKYVVLYGLSQRNWQPKSKAQKVALKTLRFLPNRFLSKWCYKNIYQYDFLEENFRYCYWITKASFQQGLFDKSFFQNPVDIPFEDTRLLGSEKIEQYLTYRYGDYRKLPSAEQQKMAVHAMVFDTERDYSEYIGKI